MQPHVLNAVDAYMWDQCSSRSPTTMRLVLVLFGVGVVIAQRHHPPRLPPIPPPFPVHLLNTTREGEHVLNQHHNHHQPHPHPRSASLSNHQHHIGREERKRFMVVDATTGIQYNPHSRNQPGRHVCTEKRDVAVPVKVKQSYCKPVYKTYFQKCKDDQLCTGVKLEYETAYRDVVTTRSTRQTSYVCCPGWTAVNNRSNGCNKPVCTEKCQNGGICVKPNVCNCPHGFYGHLCEFDINECKEQKPCDQICHNTYGSYKCECRENFVLASDGQTCKNEGEIGPGIEAKEMEYEILNKRLLKLEEIVDGDKGVLQTHNEILKINKQVEIMSRDVDDLKLKLIDVEKQKKDFFTFRNTLGALQKNTDKINELWLRYDKMKKCAFANKICL